MDGTIKDDAVLRPARYKKHLNKKYTPESKIEENGMDSLKDVFNDTLQLGKYILIGALGIGGLALYSYIKKR